MNANHLRCVRLKELLCFEKQEQFLEGSITVTPFYEFLGAGSQQLLPVHICLLFLLLLFLNSPTRATATSFVTHK